MPSYRITLFTESTKTEEFIVHDDNSDILLAWLREWWAGDKSSIKIDKIEDKISNFNIICEINTWNRQLDKGMPVLDVLMVMDKKLTEWMQVANSRRKRRCIGEQVINPSEGDTIANAVRTIFRRLHHKHKHTSSNE